MMQDTGDNGSPGTHLADGLAAASAGPVVAGAGRRTTSPRRTLRKRRYLLLPAGCSECETSGWLWVKFRRLRNQLKARPAGDRGLRAGGGERYLVLQNLT
jgi:hypothetical protein